MSSRDRSDESSPSLRRTLLGVAVPTRADSSEPVRLNTPPNSDPPVSGAAAAAPVPAAPVPAAPVIDTEPMSRPPTPQFFAEPTEMASVHKPQVREPVPNPATSLGKPLNPPEPVHLSHQQLAQSHDPTALVRQPHSHAATRAGVGDGPIRVVCRRCDRSVWGWKLPFGVSCPIDSHHAHISWWMVGVVASFWTVFVMLTIALVAIVTG